MNPTWTPSKQVKVETWGAFLEYARASGVTVEKLPKTIEIGNQVFEGPEYLQRVLPDGTKLHFPLPPNWSEDRVLRYWNMTTICSRLKLPAPKWPVTL